MLSAIVLSPTDAASQKPVVGPAERVVVARVWATRNAAVLYCVEHLGSKHPEFKLGGSARSVVQFDGVLLEAVPCVACALIDLDGQVGIGVDVPPEVYKLVRLVLHMVHCLYTKYDGGFRHPFRA